MTKVERCIVSTPTLYGTLISHFIDSTNAKIDYYSVTVFERGGFSKVIVSSLEFPSEKLFKASKVLLTKVSIEK